VRVQQCRQAGPRTIAGFTADGRVDDAVTPGQATLKQRHPTPFHGDVVGRAEAVAHDQNGVPAGGMAVRGQPCDAEYQQQ